MWSCCCNSYTMAIEADKKSTKKGRSDSFPTLKKLMSHLLVELKEGSQKPNRIILGEDNRPVQIDGEGVNCTLLIELACWND